jgi:hypothetical protein
MWRGDSAGPERWFARLRLRDGLDGMPPDQRSAEWVREYEAAEADPARLRRPPLQDLRSSNEEEHAQAEAEEQQGGGQGEHSLDALSAEQGAGRMDHQGDGREPHQDDGHDDR